MAAHAPASPAAESPRMAAGKRQLMDAAVRLLSVDEQRGFLQRHGEDADPLQAAMCDAIRALSSATATVGS